MLKKRIIPLVLIKDSTTVKGISFDSWRRVGSITQAVKIFSLRDVDELIILDISATPKKRPPCFNIIKDQAKFSSMPLTVGGGIKSIEDIKQLLMNGADKVSICSELISNINLVKEASSVFGSQCITAAIDIKKIENKYFISYNCGNSIHTYDIVDFLKKVQDLGAGEFLFNFVHKDGKMNGYDLEFFEKLPNFIEIPIILAGGCGSYNHMLAAFQFEKISAVAAGSIFYFTELTPTDANIFLKKNGILVRKL